MYCWINQKVYQISKVPAAAAEAPASAGVVLIKKKTLSAGFLCSAVCPNLSSWMAVASCSTQSDPWPRPIWKIIDWNRAVHFLLPLTVVMSRQRRLNPLGCWMPNFQAESFIFCFFPRCRWCLCVSSKCVSDPPNCGASTHLTPHPLY